MIIIDALRWLKHWSRSKDSDQGDSERCLQPRSSENYKWINKNNIQKRRETEVFILFRKKTH